MREFIPYGRQWIDEEDIRAVVRVLRSPWITQGPKVAEFEEAFASMWKTAKAKGISKKDIEQEIKAHRKENA